MHVLKVLILSTVIFGSFCQKKPQPQQELIRKRAEQLIYEYRDIAVGDAKYKGKELFIKGKILKAEPDEGIVMFKGTPSDIYPAVICHFADDLTREAIRESFKDQEIIVQGVNTGYSHDGVHLRPCRISSDPGPGPSK